MGGKCIPWNFCIYEYMVQHKPITFKRQKQNQTHLMRERERNVSKTECLVFFLFVMRKKCSRSNNKIISI